MRQYERWLRMEYKPLKMKKKKGSRMIQNGGVGSLGINNRRIK
jgi:hypothetical protein